MPSTLRHFAHLHLIVLFGTLGVIVLAMLTRTAMVQQYDDYIETYADRHRLRLRRIAGVATLTGEKFVHPVIAALTAAILLALRPGTPMRFLIPLATASLGGIIAHHLVKFVYHRPRPEIALRRDKTEGAYPSGHTTNATAVVATSAYLLVHEQVLGTSAAVACVALLCTATGMSRVLLGWHWATDVLGGWMAGASVAALAASIYWVF